VFCSLFILLLFVEFNSDLLMLLDEDGIGTLLKRAELLAIIAEFNAA
jgi:hypothetical protein